MGFHYEDGASWWRPCWPLSAKARYGLRLEMKARQIRDITSSPSEFGGAAFFSFAGPLAFQKNRLDCA